MNDKDIKPFEPVPHCVPMTDRKGRRVGHISMAGPELRMVVAGREFLFEMHNYFGPIPLNRKTHEPLVNIPNKFWDGYERWDLAGRLVNGDACVLPEWCDACKGSGYKTKIKHGMMFHDGNCPSCDGRKIKPIDGMTELRIEITRAE